MIFVRAIQRQTRLPRRPSHSTAAEQVQVEMVHGLAAFRACIHNDAVTAVKVLGAGDLRRHPEQVTEQRAIALIGIAHGADVPAGNDEDVDWRLGMKVGEGVTGLILVNGGGWYSTFDDLAEQAAHSETSVHER